MEDNKLKFVGHSRKKGNKFILEQITGIYLKISTHSMIKSL